MAGWLLLAGIPAGAQVPAYQTNGLPLLKSNDVELDTLSAVFHLALGDIASNIRMRHQALPGQERPLLFAGFDYTGAWTRDAAINVWSGAGLLYPQVSKNTLLEVLTTNAKKDSIIGGQYWDKMIWTLGAWQYYLFQGDRAFLRTAYKAAANTLRQLEQDEFDETMGLFRGAAVYGDGIAAYDDDYLHTGEYEGGAWLSNIDKWPEANPEKRAATGWGLPMMVLSTNCMYVQVYQVLQRMQQALHLPVSSSYRQKQQRLTAAINRHFWDEGQQRYRYYIDPWKACDAQEGLGLSFALLFGIATPAQVQAVLNHAVSEPAGIPCVYPSFGRYLGPDGQQVGRHSGSVWPHVQGFWAEAAAQHRRPDRFWHELAALSRHAYRDAQFRELYHPRTGLPDGGLQEDGFEKGKVRAWKSCERQTWAATGFLRMVLFGLFGLHFSEAGIHIQPLVPTAYPQLRLSGLQYRPNRAG